MNKDNPIQNDDYINIVKNYFDTIDNSLDKLCTHQEGKIANLPTWVLTKRKTDIVISPDSKRIAIKSVHIDNSDNIFNFHIAKDIKSFHDFSIPLVLKNDTVGFISSSDLAITFKNPLKPPSLEKSGYLGTGSIESYKEGLTKEKAVKNALDLWNRALHKVDNTISFIQEVTNIFSKLKCIIRRKSFVERKIHRFINEHHRIILPSHKNCFYEHVIYNGNEFRKADFILERETTIPPLLIELESPVHNVCTKVGNFTKETNHAKTQLSEWVDFISSDGRNISGEFSFLNGPKARLVIIGKGLEDKEKLSKTKRTIINYF